MFWIADKCRSRTAGLQEQDVKIPDNRSANLDEDIIQYNIFKGILKAQLLYV